ncbi:50S ribosomal protein L2 [Striga asiatica]|uniref:50S ribosomal protein L2 n=1 Tax=Striga asiatica TaxID=4170 RepID=A0A5A7P7Z4_STRAF|nr:50S ribosomal protein L2 [Striga asiatica]
MSSPIAFAVDDKDLDDAALWAVIDSAAAAAASSAVTRRPRTKPQTPIPFPLNSPQSYRRSYNHSPDGEVVQNNRPHKIFRTAETPRVHASSPPQLAIVKQVSRTPEVSSPAYGTGSMGMSSSAVTSFHGPIGSEASYEKVETRHCLAGQFPTVSLFKDYQNAAMAILEKNDYTMISGNPYIKKSGWRKISFYFNLSYEIKDKTIEYDDNRNVQRAEFIVRAYMQGGRFSDGWGSCERREKKFQKPNHDIPSTAETRAKNRACQDLLGIGEYRPGAKHSYG